MLQIHKDAAAAIHRFSTYNENKRDGEYTYLEGMSCTRELLELQVTTTKLTYI